MKFLTHPAGLMCAVWAAAITLFYVSPISYVHSPGIVAWTIILGGIALFCSGALVGGRRKSLNASATQDPSLDNLVVVCAALGFIGIAAMTFDKLYLSDIDWSQGLSAARDKRANEVMENIGIRRSWLLYFGYLTFSFSCVAITIFMLAGERLRTFASICGQASVLPMTIYAVLYGGRMPILLVILLFVGASITRVARGRTLVPADRWLWWKFAFVAVAFLAYTNQVWQTRRDMNRMSTYPTFLAVAASRWEMQPTPLLDSAIRNGTVPANLAMDWLSIDMYLTHPPTTVQRMVEHWREFSIYGGLYQIGILSPISDIVAPSLKLPQTMRTELSAIGAYGWFPSAWGAWIGDAGLIGGAFCVFVWGLLSGFCYRQTLERSSLSAALMLTFAYLGILVSPLNGPFGFANSFLIFLSFAATYAWLSWRNRAIRKSDAISCSARTSNS
ncbi:oligosaccharide repeat unit polymerase [Bradyrhizobium sp. AUGA SZCCT0169]|uniref:O-antigen polymerase n=1 Tax=Bradyrhizobium sp. AUGA SZCCT0169 TaxID=2807663 RepID=UPI001BADAE01|nr:O-antigen polymerase [Bradyrhizobium sp. AUGA SZCCT0169]MBR1249475.1 oligosaccharide repeat unit polymerase [Bradyrhizobium sp. AUGA SZCCT0169]